MELYSDSTILDLYTCKNKLKKYLTSLTYENRDKVIMYIYIVALTYRSLFLQKFCY